MRVEINKNQLQQNKLPLTPTPVFTPSRRGRGRSISFQGPLDGIITQSLITIDTNPMVNATLVDVFAMVIPGTYIDTKKRNKYAGAETFFRELAGTFTVCLSSGIFAKWIAHLYNKFIEPEIKINPNSWVTDDSLNFLKHSWDKSNKNSEKYISNILSNLSGVEGKEISEWKNINWKNVEWIEDSKWEKFVWKDAKFNNIQNNLKDKEQIIKTLGQIIEDKNIDKKDTKQLLAIAEHRITNALKATNSVNVRLDDKTLKASLKNILRDSYDLGKDVFANKSINLEKALNKIQKMNKTKTLGALLIASTLGLTNQYINRKITKKRTGTDAFVGEVDYKNIVDKKDEKKSKENKSRLLTLKLLSSAGIIALAAIVMKIRSPKDFIKKLEFTGPITSGNAIKTVYTATLAGRFLASYSENELVESDIRDYSRFLNWLVFGGFAAKGVANLLDKDQSNLFNIHKEGKGLKHWLNDISLKSHAEVAAKGTEFAKKNIWKLNLAHSIGFLYSLITLGLMLPLLNIAITKNKHKKAQQKDTGKFFPSAAGIV